MKIGNAESECEINVCSMAECTLMSSPLLFVKLYSSLFFFFNSVNNIIHSGEVVYVTAHIYVRT